MSDIDLSQLPAPDAIEALDFETILAERKARFVALYPQEEQATIAALLEIESEPIVRILEENAYCELLLRARYNDEARALMLAYSVGADLDHIGITYYQESRKLITAANTTTVPPTEAVYESDDSYRARLASKPESYSTAGPTGAYEWFAKNASPLVLDAKADSPVGGTTRVAILSTEGDGTPTDALLATVVAALNPEEVRPLCEVVEVVPAQIHRYSITALLYVLPGPDPAVVRESALAALQAYAEGRRKLGYDVTLSGLYAAAHVAGVQRATLNLNADIVCNNLQATYCESITVTLAGVDQ